MLFIILYIYQVLKFTNVLLEYVGMSLLLIGCITETFRSNLQTGINASWL